MAQLSFAEVSFLTFQAVVEVILVCFAGFYAAKSGILTKSAQKYISLLNVDIFTPALVFSKLAPSLSLAKLFEIILIPIFYAISTGISYLVSVIVSKYLGLDEYESNFVTAMSVFGNSNSLPVSLTMTLAYTLPNLEWDDIDDDDPSKIAARGMLYLLIFQQIGQVLRWSWGYNTLLKRIPSEEHRPLTSGDEVTYSSNHESSATLITYDQEQQVKPPSIKSNTSVNDRLVNSDESSINSDYNLFIDNPISQFFIRINNSMNPPLYAMLASVIVASVPLIHDEFFVKDGFIQNTLAEAIRQLGTVSIPLILIVLGSNLYPSGETPPATPHYRKIVFGSLISRMIIPPLFLLPLIAVVVRYIKVSILDDPIFLVVAFILTISPPAIQLSQICQLNELFEMEMAGVLFWGYVVLTLPTTIFVVSASLEVLNWAKAL